MEDVELLEERHATMEDVELLEERNCMQCNNLDKTVGLIRSRSLDWSHLIQSYSNWSLECTMEGATSISFNWKISINLEKERWKVKDSYLNTWPPKKVKAGQKIRPTHLLLSISQGLNFRLHGRNYTTDSLGSL